MADLYDVIEIEYRKNIDKGIPYPVLTRLNKEEYDKLDKTGTMEHNGSMYSWQIVSPKRREIFVQKFTVRETPEKTYNDDDFECPYCGEKISDSWEYDRDTEIELDCGVCYNTFCGTAEVSVTYKAYIKEK